MLLLRSTRLGPKTWGITKAGCKFRWNQRNKVESLFVCFDVHCVEKENCCQATRHPSNSNTLESSPSLIEQ
eukprot:6489737-Amphidinium_carterae.1